MRKVVTLVLMLLGIAVLGAGCGLGSGGNSGPAAPNINNQSQQAAQQRADAFARASNLFPAPNMQNFPLRKALVALTEAQDKLNHPWYVYIQAPLSGQVIAYYVAKTAPQSECNTLSSTQSIVKNYDDNGGMQSYELTAPTLNGVYSGGAGASGSCSTVFFQDATTGAFIEINGDAFFTTDQPLALNVPRLKVAVK